MARPGRSEDTSVPIWLKLSAADSAKMDQVLARPEFEGWTRGEWCLEIIQTALRYYTKPRPAGEPGRKRAPAPPAAAPAPPPAETVSSPAEPVPPPGEPGPPPVRPAPPRARPARPARAPQARRPSRPKSPQPPGPEAPRPEPQRPQPQRPQPQPPQPGPEPLDAARVDAARVDEAEPDRLPELDCSHPAEARDYQSGTCGACGAILWD